MKKTVLSALMAASVQGAPAAAVPDECVVLLHGLARSSHSMSVLERGLVEAGYRVLNVGYPSRDYSVTELASMVVPAAIAQCADCHKLHFVTHSMGGMLVRQYFEESLHHKLGRVVMLAPPHQGSEVVDKLGSWRLYHWVNGPAGADLVTGESGVAAGLGPVRFELGVIAGTRTVNPFLSMLLPGEDDGKVTVAATSVEGMADKLVMPVTHTFMMRNQRVIKQVIHFLSTGHFDR